MLTFSAYSEAICLISSDCSPTIWPTALAVSFPYRERNKLKLHAQLTNKTEAFSCCWPLHSPLLPCWSLEFLFSSKRRQKKTDSFIPLTFFETWSLIHTNIKILFECLQLSHFSSFYFNSVFWFGYSVWVSDLLCSLQVSFLWHLGHPWRSRLRATGEQSLFVIHLEQDRMDGKKSQSVDTDLTALIWKILTAESLPQTENISTCSQVIPPKNIPGLVWTVCWTRSAWWEKRKLLKKALYSSTSSSSQKQKQN